MLDDAGPVGPLWADFGAGSGTFTFALLDLLGEGGRVIAVDREAAAVEALRRGMAARAGADPEDHAGITAVRGDFTELDGIEALTGVTLDGALFANALHFDPSPARTLAAAGRRVRAGGRVVVVEYQDRPPNPWVPHPLPMPGLADAADAAGLGVPAMVGERPSSYGGVLYCAWMGVAE